MELDRCNYKEIEEYLKKNDSVIIAIGAIAQHGCGCSLGTDARIPDAVATQVSEQLGIMRIPILPYGVSTNHLEFAGTISLKPSTLSAMFRDIFVSLYRHGFRRFFVINGHVDNNRCLTGEILTLMDEFPGCLLFIRDFWEFDQMQALMKEQLGEVGSHNRATDVSLMMHLSNDEVKTDLLTAERPVVNAFVSHDLMKWYGTKEGSIVSDQCKATPHLGAQMFNCIVESFKEDVVRLLNIDLNVASHPQYLG